MEESRLKQLRGLRNNEIISLASKHGLSVSSLSYLFNLSGSQIRQIASAYLVSPENVIRHSIEDLDNWRNNRKKYYSSQNLSPEEIDYIFHKGSLVQSEEIQSLKCQVSQLLSEKSELNSQIEKLKLDLQLNDLEIKTLKSDVERKDKNINNILSKYKSCIQSKESLESSLGASNKKIKDLEADIKESKEQLELKLRASQNKVDEKESVIKATQESLAVKEKELSVLTNNYSHMRKVAGCKHKKVQELELRVKELESNLQSYNGVCFSYQTELARLNSEKALLEEENKSLKSRIETLSEPKVPIDTKFKRVYNREQIKEAYKSSHYILKDTLQKLNSSGMNISYRHLYSILKDEKVLRPTYKKRKKNKK